MSKKKFVLGIAGSSGAIYAHRLLEIVSTLPHHFDLVISENAIINWELEIGPFDPSTIPYKIWGKKDFMAPFASGSSKYDGMIICPSSMGMVGRISAGVSDDLITRAADVMLKERRKLIIVPRETPYSLIHLRNMTQLTEAGAIICPACPSFYHHPDSITVLVDTVVHRVLDLAGIDVASQRWGS